MALSYHRIVVAVMSVAVCMLAGTAAAQQANDGGRSLLEDSRNVVPRVSRSSAPRDPNVTPATFDSAVPRPQSPNVAQVPTGAAPAAKNPPELLLPARSATSIHAAGGSSATSGTGQPGRLSPSTTVIGSTCLVLSLFLVAAWVLKRTLPRGAQALPLEAVEALGRSTLSKGQFVQLVRCGNKLLLVAISASSVSTLTEISDPAEVEHLLSLCGRTQRNKAAASSRNQSHSEPVANQGERQDIQQRVTAFLNNSARSRPSALAEARHA